MKAVGLYCPEPGALTPQWMDIDIATPKAGPHDLLVSVLASGVGALDSAVRRSMHHADSECQAQSKADTAPRILGFDGAGVVEAVGSEVHLFKPGDRVFYAGALDRPGSNAELQLVDERMAGPMPQSLLFAEAAALPLGAITAWGALFNRLGISAIGLDAGKRLLVVGGAGGVGSMAIQLAKKVGRLEVIATASRSGSRQWCVAQGADHVIDHRLDLAEQCQQRGIHSVDYIACFAPIEDYFSVLTQLLPPAGKIVATVDNHAPLAVSALQAKGASIDWELPLTQMPARVRARRSHHLILSRMAALVDTEQVRSTLHTELRGLCATQLLQAHQLQDAGGRPGKTVVSRN